MSSQNPLAPLLSPLLVAGGMPITLGDLLGFVSGLLCVWLVTRASIWNFPVGIFNSLVLGVVFVEQRLFADASLQVLFIALNAHGFWRWSVHGRDARATPVYRASWRRLALTLLAAALCTPLLWWVLGWLKGSAPVLDALITVLSVAAQWLLNRRVLESWLVWILVDVISVPLYFSRGLPLIALLYLVFLLLCCHGYMNWRRLLDQHPPA